MRTIQLIYNEINKNGNFRIVYYDTHGTHDNEGSFLKTIENGEMKLFKLSTEQIDQMHRTILKFMGDINIHYRYREFDNADIDNTLLLSITEDEAGSFDQAHQRYYNWQNTTPVPFGVDLLLKFFEKIKNRV